jgi:hypothetical protein
MCHCVKYVWYGHATRKNTKDLWSTCARYAARERRWCAFVCVCVCVCVCVHESVVLICTRPRPPLRPDSASPHVQSINMNVCPSPLIIHRGHTSPGLAVEVCDPPHAEGVLHLVLANARLWVVIGLLRIERGSGELMRNASVRAVDNHPQRQRMMCCASNMHIMHSMLHITLNVCCTSNMHSSAQMRVVVIDRFLHAVKPSSGARNEFIQSDSERFDPIFFDPI